MFKKILLISLIFTLQACGFQLRQAVEIPANLQPVFIQSESADQLSVLLQQRLQEQDIRLTTKAEDAKLKVTLSNEHQHNRMISVSAETTLLRELEITLQVDLSIKDANGTSVLEDKTIRQVREFVYNSNEILAHAQEAELIVKEMRNEVLTHIIRRLGHVDTERSAESK